MTARSPSVRRRRLGLELRRLREQAAMTIEQVAAALEVSDSKISRIETAQVGATPRDVRDMLTLYGAPEEHRSLLMQIAREARQKGWWQQRFGNLLASAYVGLETAASSLRYYAPIVVPGLIQHREYARAVTTAIRPDLDAEEIGQRVEMRMVRQYILTQEAPPTLWAVIDEAAVRRPVGGPAVMRQQLEHLIQCMALPNVTLQVLPFSAGEHAGMDGQFDLIGFADEADPDVVFLENTKSDLYLSDADAIRRYSMLFDHLTSSALDPADTEEFLVAAVADLS